MSQNNQIQGYSESGLPQKKQSPSILKWAKTPQEASVVKAFEGRKPFKDYDENDTARLIDVISKWRYYTGSSKNITPDDLAAMAIFIGDKWENMTLEELNLAIDLSLTGELEVDVNTYGEFSPMYASRIIQAFYAYKLKVMSLVINRRDEDQRRQMSLQTSAPSPEKNMDNMIAIIKSEYAIFDQHKVVNDPFSLIYNFIRRTNRIALTDGLIQKALEYGEKTAKAELLERAKFSPKIKDVAVALSGSTDESQMEKKQRMVKKYARNFCVQYYFERNHIDNIVKSIIIEEFR